MSTDSDDLPQGGAHVPTASPASPAEMPARGVSRVGACGVNAAMENTRVITVRSL